MHAPGTTPEARRAALGVAAEVLRRAGVSAAAAKAASDKREAWGDVGMSPESQPDEHELHAAAAWEDASQAALTHCYRGRNVPLEAELTFSDDRPAAPAPHA